MAAAHGEADQKALKALSSLVEEEFKIASERETITIAMREASLRVTTARQAEAQAAAEAEAKLKQDIYKELYAQAKQADELAEDFLFTAQNMKMLIDKLHQIDFHAAPNSADHSHKKAVTSRLKKIGICQLRSRFGSQSGSMRLRCAASRQPSGFERFKASEYVIKRPFWIA